MNAARKLVQIGKMPAVRRIRHGRTVVGDGNCPKSGACGSRRHFLDRTVCVCTGNRMGMQICNNLHLVLLVCSKKRQANCLS